MVHIEHKGLSSLISLYFDIRLKCSDSIPIKQAAAPGVGGVGIVVVVAVVIV